MDQVVVITERNPSLISVVLQEPRVITDSSTPAMVVVERFERSAIVIEQHKPTLVQVGIQGPKGARGDVGPAGSPISITKTASTALGGNRVVFADGEDGARYADNANVAHRDRIIGITTGAADSGSQVAIQNGGEMIEPGWNWQAEKLLFVGINGLLTQTPPSHPAVFRRSIGTALSPTKIRIEIRDPLTFA